MAGRDAAPNGLPSALTSSIALLMRAVSRRAGDLLEEALAPLSLRSRHYGILATLAESGPASQQALGRRLGVDRTTMVGIVDDLERLRLVVRQPSARDRRAHRIELTARGRTTLVRATGAVTRAESALLGTLADGERATLARLLLAISAPPALPGGASTDTAPAPTDAASIETEPTPTDAASTETEPTPTDGASGAPSVSGARPDRTAGPS